MIYWDYIVCHDDISLCDALLDEEPQSSGNPCVSERVGKRSLVVHRDGQPIPTRHHHKVLVPKHSSPNLSYAISSSDANQQILSSTAANNTASSNRRSRSQQQTPMFYYGDRRPPLKSQHSSPLITSQSLRPSPQTNAGLSPYHHYHHPSSVPLNSAGTSRFPQHHSAMVVRNVDGTVNVERGRREGFYAPSIDREMIGQPKYQAHKGRNRFCFNGRLMMANNNGAFFVTLFLIIVTMASFYIFDAVYVAEHISLSLPIIASVLFISVMANLFKTSFSDPGILPRANNREVIEHERIYKCETGNPNASIPRTKMVGVLKECVVLKYCYTCRVFRPPRSSHCSVCDNCVLRFDHHCPFVSNCIGLRNYRSFYMFIVLLTILDLFVGACSITHLVMLSIEKGKFIYAIHTSPGSLFVTLVCLISVWSVLGLSGFHTYLLASNQTTNEEVKDAFADLWPSYCGSLYSTGNLFTNCFGVLCAPEIPSLLDRRGKIIPDPVIHVSPDAFMTAQKLRLAYHLDPNNHATVQPDNGQIQESSTSIDNNQAVVNVENSQRRHSLVTLTDSSSSASVRSYSSCTVVHNVPDERPASPTLVTQK